VCVYVYYSNCMLVCVCVYVWGGCRREKEIVIPAVFECAAVGDTDVLYSLLEEGDQVNHLVRACVYMTCALFIHFVTFNVLKLYYFQFESSS